MRYLKYFESKEADILSLIKNNIFVELIDDDIVGIASEQNPIILEVTTDDREDASNQSDDIDELLARSKRKYEIYGRLKIAFKKLESIGVSFQITENDEGNGYMLVSIFNVDLNTEYFSITDKSLIIKKGNIEKDFNCSVNMSTSGSEYWINLTFKGDDDNDTAAKGFYDKMKTFTHKGKPIIYPVHCSTGGFGKDGKLENNKNHPFGEYYAKDSREFAEISKHFPSTSRNVQKSKIYYAFGLNNEFTIEW